MVIPNKEAFFENNVEYSALTVKEVFARFTSQGVAVFQNTGNLPGDLNAAINELATVGVLSLNGNECQVINDNGFKVLKGAVVTEYGIVCFDTEALDIANTGTVYVGLQGTAIYTGDNLPASDYIPFAQVTDGVITDTRLFAKAKIQTPCYSGGVEYGEITFTDADKNPDGEFIKVYTPQIPISNDYTRRCYMLNQKVSNRYDGTYRVMEPRKIQAGYATLGYYGLGTYYASKNGTNIKFKAEQTTPQGSTYHGGTLKFILY